MKKALILLTMFTIALTASAQQHNIQNHKQGMMKANPEMMKHQFTEDQQKQMAELRLKHQKETLQLNNEINEKTAQLKTLQQLDKPNLRDINSKIDEISALQNKKMKSMAAHRNSVRSLLTDEQRIQFDMKMNRENRMNKGDRMNKGHKQGNMKMAPMGQNGMMHKEIEVRQIQKQM